MFERFTEQARKAISCARQEVQRLHHDKIATGHLLLGISMEERAVAAKILEHVGVDRATIRREGNLIPAQSSSTPTLIPFSPRAKRAIELAGDNADRMGHPSIATDHLLLGLLQAMDGILPQESHDLGPDVLHDLGLQFEKVREVVIEIRSAEPDDSPAGRGCIVS